MITVSGWYHLQSSFSSWLEVAAQRPRGLQLTCFVEHYDNVDTHQRNKTFPNMSGKIFRMLPRTKTL